MITKWNCKYQPDNSSENNTDTPISCTWLYIFNISNKKHNFKILLISCEYDIG